MMIVFWKTLLSMLLMGLLNGCGRSEHTSSVTDTVIGDAEVSDYDWFENELISLLKGKPDGSYYYANANIYGDKALPTNDPERPRDTYRIDYAVKIKISDGKVSVEKRDAYKIILMPDTNYPEIDIYLGDSTFFKIDEKSESDNRFISGSLGDPGQFKDRPSTPEEAANDDRNGSYGADPTKKAPLDLPLVDTPRKVPVFREYSNQEDLQKDVEKSSREFLELFAKDVKQSQESRSKNKGDISQAIGRYKSSVASVLDLLPTDVPNEPEDHIRDREVLAKPLVERIKNARRYTDFAKRKIGDGLTPEQDRALEGSRAAYNVAEDAAQNFDLDKSEAAVQIGVALTDFALSMTPGVGVVKDLYEAVTGTNLLTGKKLDEVERTLAVIGVLTAGTSHIFTGSKKVGEVIAAIGTALETAADQAKAAKSVQKAANIVDSAKGNFPNLHRTVEFLKNNDIPVNKRREVIEAFNPNSQVKVLTEDTKVYRYWVEGFNGPKGHWVTRNKVNDPLSELALPHSGPYKEQEWVIPKGTEILEGMAAPNFKQPGGAGQIFVPNPGVLQ